MSIRSLLVVLALLAVAGPASAAQFTATGTEEGDVIVVQGDHGQITLNGEVVLTYRPGNDQYSAATGDSSDFVNLSDALGKDRYSLDTGDGADNCTLVDITGKDAYTGNFGAGDDLVGVTDALGKDTHQFDGGPDTGSPEGDALVVPDPFADGDKDLLNGWESGTGFNQGS